MFTTLPVQTILQRVTTSVDWGYGEDFTWDEMLRSKCQDAQFDYLVDSIAAEGFTVPIDITIYTPSGDLNWNLDRENAQWEMGNGHHRLAAAILLGLDEVPVVINDAWSHSNGPMIPRDVYRDSTNDYYQMMVTA